MTSDGELVAALRGAWEDNDAPPAELADRMVFAVQLERLEAEVMALEEEMLLGAGSRGEEVARTLTFSGSEVSVMVTITAGAGGRSRLDGWVAPCSGGRVEARRADGHVREGEVDGNGHFVLERVPAGLVQLVYHPGGPEGSPRRSVAAPPVRI